MIDLGSLKVSGLSSVLEIRRKVMRLAVSLNFDELTATRIATASSEMSRRLLRNGAAARVSISLDTGSGTPALCLRFGDPEGFPPEAVPPGFFDRVQRFERAEGLCGVNVFKGLSGQAPEPTDAFVRSQRERIQQRSRSDLMAEIQAQNEELRRHSSQLEEAVAQRTADLKEAMELAQAQSLEATLLHRAAELAAETDSIEAVLGQVVAMVCEMTGWPVGHVYQVSPDDSELMEPTSIWYLQDEEKFAVFREVTEKTTFRVGVGMPGRILESGKPAWITDVGLDDNSPRAQLAANLGVIGAFGFPVQAGDRTVAVLEFFLGHRMERDEALLRVMRNLGRQVGAVFEKNQAAAVLAESRQLLESIIENSPSYIFVKDLEGHYLLMNEPLIRQFGLERNQILGKTDAEIFPPELADKFRKDDLKILKSGAPIEVEDSYEGPEGLKKYLSVKFPIRDQEGDPHAICGVATDITEIQKLAEDLETARQAAESANRAKSQFLANMSHELRTPLNGVLGYAQILLRDPGATAGQKKRLDAIENCGKHLLTLINDVLDLSKIEAGRLELERSVCRLDSLVQSVSDIARPKAEEKGLAFEVKLSSELPDFIATDPTKLKQTLVNLLGNAVKFTAQGSVTLEAVRPKPEVIEFRIRDTGIGMTVEEQNHIFDPFKQAEGGITHGGTGLGLSISKKIMELMGGTMTVESEKGSGSCFAVAIPFQEIEPDESSAQIEEEARSEFLRLADGQDFSVLIADDQDYNREVLKELLIPAGFETREAGDGAIAVQSLRKAPASIVLMDIRMPNLDGFGALRQIREDADLSAIPVVAVSASVLSEFQDKIETAGFDGFVSKPFQAGEIFSAIKRLTDAEFVDASTSSEADGPPQPDPTEGSVPEIDGELARRTAAKVREAVEVGDVMILASLGEELKEDPSSRTVGLRIEDLANSLDLDGLISFATELEGRAAAIP